MTLQLSVSRDRRVGGDTIRFRAGRAALRQGVSAPRAVTLQEGFGERWVSSTVIVSVAASGAGEVARVLSTKGIATRRWWGGGLHRHAAFAECPRDRTANTERLAESVLGLPCWRDLPNDKIDEICEHVLGAAV